MITKKEIKPIPKDDLIVICLSKEDKELIQEKAVEQKLTLSSYCLSTIFKNIGVGGDNVG